MAASLQGIETQGFRLEAELISAAFDLDPSGGGGEVLAFLQACVDAQYE